MKIIEVRDGFIKFESNEKLEVSSFIQVEDKDRIYVGQVIQTRPVADKTVVYAKFLYVYDGTFIPNKEVYLSSEAKLSVFPFEIFSRSLYSNNPIVVGNFANEEIFIPIDKECFNNKLLVSVDDINNKNLLLSNLVKQFANHGNIVVFDMLGDLEGEKIVAGKDFKLPLNTASLEFMYEDCLNDATSDSKALIKEIFTDLSEYSKTVEFLPLTVLKSIVDDMVENSHVFKLLVLKNKLAKFEKLGYFATNIDDAENIKKILATKSVIIDLSKLDLAFQNRYMTFVYSYLEALNENVQVFVNASNSITKKSLKTLLTNEVVPTTLFVHSRFKYLNELKSMFENFIVEPSLANNENFKKYIKFLGTMLKGCFLLVGTCTNYLPLVSKFEPLNIETTVIQIPEKTEVEQAQEVVVELTEDELEDVVEEVVLDEETLAINKKSEDLIEKVAEEVVEQSISPTEAIFAVDDDDEDSDDENTDAEVVENVESEVEVASDNLEEISVEEDVLDEETIIEEVVADEETIEIGEVVEVVESEAVEITEDDLEVSEIIEDEITEEDLVVSEITEAEEVAVEDEIIEVSIDDNLAVEEFLEVEEQNEVLTPEDTAEKVLEALEDNESDDSLVLEVSTEPEYHTQVESTKLEEISDEHESEPQQELVQEYEEVVEEISEVVIEDDGVFQLYEEIEEEVVAEETLDDTTYEQISVSSEQVEESLPVEEVPVLALEEDYDAEIDAIEVIDELDEADLDDVDIIVDIDDEEGEVLDPDALDREIVEDVDKVFTTMKEDTISDSDLDFIDELNGEPIEPEEEIVSDTSMEELPSIIDEEDDDDDVLLAPIEEVNDYEKYEEKEILETRNSTTPIVPVYNAEIPQEDMVMSDPIEQGDVVYHAKHGNGVVEKMIKYGNKTLYSINFDNVGRRLLDPTLTEIKKA